MNSAIERLLTLRVADVMSREVIAISASYTMSEAAATLAQHGISGAPVIDGIGRCTGILSATDFVLRDSAQVERRQLGGLSGQEHKLVRPSNRSCSIEDVAEDRVCRHMSSAVQTVLPDRSLLVAARMMCAEHIHRLPVVDKQNRLLGMITSLDIVAAMDHAIEE